MDAALNLEGVTVLTIDGDRALLRTDAVTWGDLQARGDLHTDRAMLERPFEPDLPVEIEVERGPAGDWWATTATQVVPLPPDLADEGELREGIKFPTPPWRA